MSTNKQEYQRQYRIDNLERIKEIENKSLQKRRQNPEWRQQMRDYRRIYMRQYRRKHGIPERKFTGENIGRNLKSWLKKLSIKYGNYCVKCGTTERLSVNHKIPRCIGGVTEEKNLEIMCLSCNIKTFHELMIIALKKYFNKL